MMESWNGVHVFARMSLNWLQFDLDRDGVDEIFIVSFNGSIFAYSWQGQLLNSTTVGISSIFLPETEILAVKCY